MKKITRISLEEIFLPYKWMEHLVAENKIGGVLLVFLEGKNKNELREKTKEIKKFCKQLKNLFSIKEK